MKIISKKQDYYDGSGNYSVEPIWYRKEEKIVLSETKPNNRLSLDQVKFLNNTYTSAPYIYDLNDRCECIVMGLCGKIFPVFILMHDKCPKYNTSSLSNIHRHSAHMTVESFDEKCKKVIPKKENDERVARIKEDHDDRRKYRYSFSRRKFSAYKRGVVETFQNSLIQSVVDQIFIDLSSPLFIITSELVNNNRGGTSRKNILIKEPLLNQYMIQKMLDPWTLYQQIEMYLANELVMCKVPPFNTTDKLKRDAHGFDGKSFKNEKGHKRGKV